MQDRTPLYLVIYTFMVGLVFFLPIIVLYYRDIGLSFKDFMLGEALFATVLILAEVPSGYLADRWSRKGSIIIATLAGLVGYTLLVTADSLADTLIAQGVLGIMVAMNSGTLSALMYDSLSAQGREKEYGKWEGRRHGLGLYAVAIGCVIGGFAYSYHWKLPLYLEIVMITLSFIPVLLMKEPERHLKTAETNPFLDIWETVRYCLHGHKRLAATIFIGVFVFSSTKQLLWAQQPLYLELGISEVYFGVLSAIGFILGGIGGQFGHRVFAKLNARTFLLGSFIILSTGAFVAATITPIISIVFILFGSLTFGACMPQFQYLINKEVGSHRRATTLSAFGFLISLAFIPLGLLSGFLEESSGISYSLTAIGLWCLLGGAISFALWRIFTNRENAASAP